MLGNFRPFSWRLKDRNLWNLILVYPRTSRWCVEQCVDCISANKVRNDTAPHRKITSLAGSSQLRVPISEHVSQIESLAPSRIMKDVDSTDSFFVMHMREYWSSKASRWNVGREPIVSCLNTKPDVSDRVTLLSWLCAMASHWCLQLIGHAAASPRNPQAAAGLTAIADSDLVLILGPGYSIRIAS